jgi:HNH/ENDO VII superfamily nuclease with conserved GHE residues
LKNIIEGKFHYGHIQGREFRRLVVQAEAKGMTQQEFNDWVNSHPEWFQIEDPSSNMSHRFEKPGKD